MSSPHRKNLGRSGKPCLVSLFRILGWDWRELRERVAAKDKFTVSRAEILADINALDEHPIHIVIQRVVDETGLAREDLEEVAWRINTDFGLRRYKTVDGAEYRDLSDIPPILGRLDRDGVAEDLMRELYQLDSPLIAELELPKPQSAVQEDSSIDSHRDEPDENGYVAAPSDSTAYVPVTKIVNEHTPTDMPIGLNRICEILKDYVANHVRWTRPNDKRGDPIRNRRSVHLTDWHRYI